MTHDMMQPPSSRVVERVLRSHGERPSRERQAMATGSAEYDAFVVTPGFPRMGFTLGVYLREARGIGVQSHGILYPDLKKPKWKTFEGMDYINFSHSGEAYTLRGRGLYEMYLAMMDCTLQSALEFEPSVFQPLAPGAPIIDRVQVTDVAEMVRRSRDDREGRNRPAN